MSLYVHYLEYMQYILPDLLEIAEGDLGIGDIPAFDKAGNPRPDLRQITYVPSVITFSSNLLSTLVNQNQFAITIFGIASSELIPPPVSQPASIKAGGTIQPWNIPDPDQDQIEVYYDVYDCNGANHWVMALDNVTHAYFPTYMILFHELSHAMHIVDGSYKQGMDTGLEEIRASTDENTFRQQHINLATGQPQPLLLRGLTHQGGCGYQVPPAEMKTPTKNSYCFIATAALSQRAPAQLQQIPILKERFSSLSAVVRTFMAGLTSQYYGFSPAIAEEMNRSPRLKGLLTSLVVEPLMIFYGLCAAYLRQDTGGLARSPTLAAFIRHTIDFPPKGLPAANEVRSLLKGANRPAASDALRSGRPIPSFPATSGAAEALDYLFASIRANAPPNDWLDWGLSQPLSIYWSVADVAQGDTSKGLDIVAHWGASLEAWLSEAPLPDALFSNGERFLEEELHRLRDTVFIADSVRKAIADRIGARADSLPYDVRRILANTGYL